MTFFEEVAVIVTEHLAVGLGWDHYGLADSSQWLDDPLVGVEGLVGDQPVGLHGRQNMVGTGEIMCLAAGQKEVDRVAQPIDQGMLDLGAQSAARTPDGLVRTGFFWAPALCW